jgi:hypothetical protein
LAQRLAASLVIMTMASGAAAEPMQLSVNGQSRSFLLERPAAAGPRPTIIVLHGAGGGAEREAQVSGLVLRFRSGISGEIGTRRFNMVVRVESNRMRTMESASDSGEKIIAGGRFIRTGGETPWFNKCG